MMAEFDRRSYIVRRADISRFYEGEDVALNVVAGGSFSRSVYAPVGSICKSQVVVTEVVAPADALSGTHTLMLWAGYNILLGRASFNLSVTYQYGYWLNADVVAMPSDQAAAAIMGRDILFTDTAPIIVYYYNNTDVVSTRNLTLRFSAERQVV